MNVAMHFVEFPVKSQDEDEIRAWIGKSKPKFSLVNNAK
jgi:hypothetical protein